MKVRFVGGRADGIEIQEATENDMYCWVSDEPGRREVCRIHFNVPAENTDHYDTYELTRQWPSLRWYYVEWWLLYSSLGDKFRLAPGEADVG